MGAQGNGNADKFGLAVKNSPAAGGRGGIRSPLAHPSSAGEGKSVTPSSQPTASKKTAPEASEPAQMSANGPRSPEPGRKVSQIAGIEEVSHGLSRVTELSPTMFESARISSRRIGLFLVALLLVGGAVAAYQFPKQREKVIAKLFDLKAQFISVARHQHKKPYVARGGDLVEEGERPTTAKTQVIVRRTCYDLVNKAAGGSFLTVADRVDLADCHLMQDDIASAESILKPLQPKFAQMGSNALNQKNGSRTDGDAFLTLVGLLLRYGRTQEATLLLKGRCRIWSNSIACIARAMIAAEKRVSGGAATENGVEKMFDRNLGLGGKAQARVWLAGAKIASYDGAFQQADQRYKAALAAAPREALALRKQIYEEHVYDLYARGLLPKAQSLAARALSDLKGLTPASKTKLALVQELASSDEKRRILKEALTREATLFRLRSDVGLIELLGPEAMRTGLEDDYSKLVRRTRDFYAARFQGLDSLQKRLAIWEIRMSLASTSRETTLGLISAYEKKFGESPLTHHLRGVAYAGISPNERYQILASSEFQKSVIFLGSWESLYALGVTMIRAGQGNRAAPVIKELDRVVGSKGQRYWADMLKVEWYLDSGKLAQAQKLVGIWAHSVDSRLLARILEAQILEKMGKPKPKGIDDELGRMAHSLGSREAFASPLGPMALARRPVE